MALWYHSSSSSLHKCARLLKIVLQINFHRTTKLKVFIFLKKTIFSCGVVPLLLIPMSYTNTERTHPVATKFKRRLFVAMGTISHIKQ